jgi:hypothetical protein
VRTQVVSVDLRHVGGVDCVNCVVEELDCCFCVILVRNDQDPSAFIMGSSRGVNGGEEARLTDFLA